MTRRVLLILGLLMLAAAWLGPLPQLARYSFSAHMAMHMGVVAIAAPFLALGITGSALDPVRQWPSLFPPIPISLLELVVVWAWHAPGLHHLARHTAIGLVAEQTTFLLSGFLVWISVFGGDFALRQNRMASGIAALLLTSMHMTLLGALLALAPRTLYEHASAAANLTPLEDQHLGGAIMLIVGSLSYLTGGLWLTATLVRVSVQRRGTLA
jgi:putative membrane protein